MSRRECGSAQLFARRGRRRAGVGNLPSRAVTQLDLGPALRTPPPYRQGDALVQISTIPDSDLTVAFGSHLSGELWIDGRKLVPGDYNYGAPGAADESVWSETGCTCVLITSTRDTLR